jgi:hypothetical protein
VSFEEYITKELGYKYLVRAPNSLNDTDYDLCATEEERDKAVATYNSYNLDVAVYELKEIHRYTGEL